MIRRSVWGAALLAAALPLAFASPVDAVASTSDLSPNYVGGAEVDRPVADRPGSLANATNRNLLEGAAGQPASSLDGQLAAVNDQLTEMAETEGALGVYYDPAGAEFVVVFPDGEVAAAAGLSQVAGPVRVEESGLSSDTVDSFTAAVQERGFHPSAGDYSYGSYVDVSEDVIVLGTDAPASVVAPLVAGYGEVVEVRFGEDAGRLRQSDPQPHWGGASITSGGSICTSGFTAQTGGVRVMVTAGHCFAPGNQVFSTGGGQAWGTFLRHVNFPDPDLAIIAGTTYQGAIYLGGVNSVVGGAVASFGDPVLGFTGYCFSGQTSGEVCGHTAVSNTGTLCDPAGCTFNLTVSNGQSALPGDSGSPFFVYSVGNVLPTHIRGITIGVIAGQTYWHRYSTIAATGVFGVPFP